MIENLNNRNMLLNIKYNTPKKSTDGFKKNLSDRLLPDSRENQTLNKKIKRFLA
jgi:hypothetical protein